MRGLFAVGVLLVFCVPGCRQSPSRPVPRRRPAANPPVSPSPAERAAWRATQADEIREVVLRYGLEQYGPYVYGEQWRKELLPECTFFLDIEEKDPSDQFLNRFAGERPLLRKRSEWKSYLATGQTDRFPGQTAGLSVLPLQWETDTKVKVRFGAILGKREIGVWDLLVTNEKGKWTVDRVLDHWVS